MTQKPYPFTKMHGLGNDFMVIDATKNPIDLSADKIKTWADRHTGIGFDQCLVIAPSTHPEADYDYFIYNADGQAAGQCGNGARCIAKYIQRYLSDKKNNVILHTNGQLMPVKQKSDGQYQVSLPVNSCIQRGNDYWYVDVGNLHAVFFAKPDWPVLIRRATRPVNITAAARDEQGLVIQTHERGVGLTQACGSAAVASALASGLATPVRVKMPGGEVTVTWTGSNPKQAELIGPAEQVFTGEIAC